MSSATLYEIEHTTRYRYSEPVREAVLTLYLKPTSDASQHLESFAITTEPGAELFDFDDPFGNRAHFFDIPGEHRELTVSARSLVALHDVHLVGKGPGPDWEDLASVARSRLWHLLHPTDLTLPGPDLTRFMEQSGIRRRGAPLTSIRDLTARIHHGLAFRTGSTRVDSPIGEALSQRSGVCQDFSHIMLAILRGWGIPARYTSGYLFPSRREEKLMAAAGHAWVECLLPGIGWIGADPTNNTVEPRHHIRVAVGRDYRDVPPTRGTFRGMAQQKMEVAVNIAVHESDDGEEAPTASGEGGTP